jgi:hypothetical protein
VVVFDVHTAELLTPTESVDVTIGQSAVTLRFSVGELSNVYDASTRRAFPASIVIGAAPGAHGAPSTDTFVGINNALFNLSFPTCVPGPAKGIAVSRTKSMGLNCSHNVGASFFPTEPHLKI